MRKPLVVSTFAILLTSVLLVSPGWTKPPVSSTSSSDGPREPFIPGLTLDVAFVNETLRAAEYQPVKATITNRSKSTVTLVQPGDGSNDGWRTPLVGLSILPAGDMRHPAKTPLRSGPRCGNINALRPKEVVTIEPGESVVLCEWFVRPSFAKAGRYSVVFYYTNRPDLPWKGVPLGEHDAEAMKRVRGSTPCRLVSRELVVDVLPANESD